MAKVKGKMEKEKVPAEIPLGRTSIVRGQRDNKYPPLPAGWGQMTPTETVGAKVAKKEAAQKAALGSWVELPYPPSVNHYWVRCRNGRVRVSDRGTQFQRDAYIMLKAARVVKVAGPARVVLAMTPPADGRKHDIDNVLKAALDALVRGGALDDDDQVISLSILKFAAEGRGQLRVKCMAWEE